MNAALFSPVLARVKVHLQGLAAVFCSGTGQKVEFMVIFTETTLKMRLRR
jgi:hypothetical protein